MRLPVGGSSVICCLIRPCLVAHEEAVSTDLTLSVPIVYAPLPLVIRCRGHSRQTESGVTESSKAKDAEGSMSNAAEEQMLLEPEPRVQYDSCSTFTEQFYFWH